MNILPLFRTAARLLTFQISRNELLQLDNRHLILGLCMTWIVGMGRSWDDTNANILQHLGIGSVMYIFVLSLLIWLVARPLSVQALEYKQVLTFIALVSPPALLYAIPVEQFFNSEVSRALNVSLLLIVATWRVALLCFYFSRFLQMRWYAIAVATLLPLALIMVPITMFRMSEAVASSMGGLREDQVMSEPATRVLDYLGTLSCAAVLPLLIIYLILCRMHKKNFD
jgi:hypothetical protein